MSSVSKTFNIIPVEVSTLGRFAKIICFVLFIALSIFLLKQVSTFNSNDTATANNISSLKQEAKPYEAELQSIRDEISAKEKELVKDNVIGTAVVGTYISDIEALNSSEGLIVLAQDADDDLLQKAAATGREIAIYCSDPDRERLAYLQKMTDSTSVVLVETATLDDLAPTLNELGYTTVLDSTGASTVLLSGITEIPACYINANYTGLSDTISSHVASKDVLIYILSSFLTEDQQNSVEALIQVQVEDGLLEYGTIAEADENVRKNAKTSQQLLDEYDQYVAERQARMDELEQIIADIYARWDDAEKETPFMENLAEKLKLVYKNLRAKLLG